MATLWCVCTCLQSYCYRLSLPRVQTAPPGHVAVKAPAADHGCLIPAQEFLGAWSGSASAAKGSQEAAQARLAAAQQDFELLEASEDEAEMEEGSEKSSEEGKRTPETCCLYLACFLDT